MIAWSLSLYVWHCTHHRDADYVRRVQIDCRMGAHGRCRHCACPCHADPHAELRHLAEKVRMAW